MAAITLDHLSGGRFILGLGASGPSQPDRRDAREGRDAHDAAQREKLLTYVFVGGGYAGVEGLAELQDFAADVVDLYPRCRLQGLRFILVEARDTSRRHTAQRGQWHKTIDRVINGLVDRPKLYLPDFKEATFPVLDEGKTYPHHNLYWVTSDHCDVRVLGGLLLSEIANLFIEAYSVRMRGGFLRFQAQYLHASGSHPSPLSDEPTRTRLQGRSWRVIEGPLRLPRCRSTA